MSNNLILITCKKRYQFATITNYKSWYERGFSKIKTFLALFHLYEASIKSIHFSFSFDIIERLSVPSHTCFNRQSCSQDCDQ